MQNNLSILFLLLVNLSLSAQDNKKSLLYVFIEDKQQHGTSFTAMNLFDTVQSTYIAGGSIVSHYSNLTVNKESVNTIFIKKPSGVRLFIPVGRKQTLSLILAAEQINSSGDFSFGTISNHIKATTSADQGLHYRGYISGDSTSFACISIFKNGEVIGVFANKEGNFIIGRMKNTEDRYVVYKSNDMLTQPRYQCATSEIAYPASLTDDHKNIVDKVTAAPPVLCKKVRLYWEGDYQLYHYNFGSDLTKTQNYLLGLFNVVATIYQNEGIMMELSKTYVWTSADPYSNGSSSQGLNSFKAYWNNLGDNFDGDLAHLIAGGTTNNGGISLLLNFDQCNKPYAYGYSNVYATFQAYPNYSWDAQVVTHETGHNLGAHHTHWCGWNTGAGNTCGAIDNCATVESASGCTTCAATTDIAALPAGFKGTIMSYCYLNNGIGVSFVNGFGPLPQAAIRSNVSTAVCLTTRNVWTGATSTAWENTGNWSCGSLPDAGTDVIINQNLPNYPVVNSMAICRSIKESSGASIKVNTNFNLTIAGRTGN